MEIQKILTSIEAALKKMYPKDIVYTDFLPNSYKRPSFWLEFLTLDCVPLNIGLEKRTAKILITCTVELNGHSHSSREVLNTRMEAVMGLFGQGFLIIDDYCLMVDSCQGDGTPDIGSITVTLSWLDVRLGYVDPEAASALRMENFNFNINGKD